MSYAHRMPSYLAAKKLGLTPGAAVFVGLGYLFGPAGMTVINAVMAHLAPGAYNLGDLSSAALKLNVPAALNLKGGVGLSLLEIMLVFLLVDLFDNVGTLVAVTKRAGLVAEDGTIPRLNRILLVDSTATMVAPGGLLH